MVLTQHNADSVFFIVTALFSPSCSQQDHGMLGSIEAVSTVEA
jgi:hypothetical protein